MTNNIFEALEVKVAFLEDALSQLSDEHYQQQKEIEKLKKQYLILVERLTHQDSDNGTETQVEDERPPHY